MSRHQARDRTVSDISSIRHFAALGCGSNRLLALDRAVWANGARARALDDSDVKVDFIVQLPLYGQRYWCGPKLAS
jgi:hypothetical protein